MALKLVSINIERDKHLDRVIPFIKKERPDVLCVQEVCEKDLPLFEALMGSRYLFSPAGRHRVDGTTIVDGEAVFSVFPVSHWISEQYSGPDATVDYRDDMDMLERSQCVRRNLTGCEIRRGSGLYRIVATHFTWKPRDGADNYQRQDIRRLLDIVEPMGALILCGDFNAPRGGEIFSFLADRYKDRVPKKYKTSLDVSLHRAGKERPQELADKMVDGLFTTEDYRASGARLVFGVSDHAAIVASMHVTIWRRLFNLWEIVRW